MNKGFETPRDFFQNIIDEGLCKKSTTSSYYYINDNVSVRCILNNVNFYSFSLKYNQANYDRGSSLLISNLELGNLLLTRELVYEKKKEDDYTTLEQINILF